MGVVFLVIHVVAAVLFIGPSAVTASLFPRYVPLSDAAGTARDSARSLQVATAVHRIARVYGALALIVPAAGLVVGILWDKFGQAWLLVAMGLTVVAGVLFAIGIVPRQRAALESPPTRREAAVLGVLAGVFNLLWLAVLILMIVQPGAPRDA